jgi:hypothetical protein
MSPYGCYNVEYVILKILVLLYGQGSGTEIGHMTALSWSQPGFESWDLLVVFASCI